jgi:hypothetical protein
MDMGNVSSKEQPMRPIYAFALASIFCAISQSGNAQNAPWDLASAWARGQPDGIVDMKANDLMAYCESHGHSNGQTVYFVIQNEAIYCDTFVGAVQAESERRHPRR